MVESGGNKIEAVNDNVALKTGDFVTITNPTLRLTIEKHFGPGIRLRIAQIRGNMIDLVSSQDYKPDMTIPTNPLHPLSDFVKSYGVSVNDIQVRPIRSADSDEPKE